MKIQHYSLNGEKPVTGIKEFFMFKLPLILYSPVSFILSVINALTSQKKDFKYKASLCLIFKDEGRYLKEWLDYHMLIGIDHFYLYNNNSTDNFMEVLRPYIDKDVVTLIDFPEQYAQVKAYNDCYKKTKNETEWLGYIDADEYINIKRHNSIKDLLDSVRFYPSVFLNWRMFGTSGHLKENYSELTIERYTQAWENLSSTGKGFINNNYPQHKPHIHMHKTKLFGLPVLGVLTNKSYRYNLHWIFQRGVAEIAYVNHYWSRSYEFYYYKDFIKGDADCEENVKLRRQDGRFKNIELQNKTKDFSIQRWLIFLKHPGKRSSSLSDNNHPSGLN